MAREMGIERILSAIAEQFEVTESSIPENATESVWAFQMFMVTQAVKRSSYSREARYIIIETFQDVCTDLAKQLNFSPEVVNSLLSKFRSQTKNDHLEQDFYGVAALLLKCAIGNEVADNDKATSIIASYIIKINDAQDRELSRYTLTW